MGHFDNLFGNLSPVQKFMQNQQFEQQKAQLGKGMRGQKQQIEEAQAQLRPERSARQIPTEMGGGMEFVDEAGRGPASVRAPAMDKKNVDANFGYGGGTPLGGMSVGSPNINTPAAGMGGQSIGGQSMGGGRPPSGGGGGGGAPGFKGPGGGTGFGGQMGAIAGMSAAGLAVTMEKLRRLKNNPDPNMSEEQRASEISDLEAKAQRQKQEEMQAKGQAEQEEFNREAMIQDNVAEKENMSQGQPADFNPFESGEQNFNVDDGTNIQTAPTAGMEEEVEEPFQTSITEAPQMRPINAYKPEDLQGFKPSRSTLKAPVMPNLPKVPKGFKRNFDYGGKIAEVGKAPSQTQFKGEIATTENAAQHIKKQTVPRPKIGEEAMNLLDEYKKNKRKKPTLEMMPTAKEWENKNMGMAGALRDLANIWLGKPIGGWAHAYAKDEAAQKRQFMQDQQSSRDKVAKRNVEAMAAHQKGEEAQQKLIMEQAKLNQKQKEMQLESYKIDTGAYTTDYETNRKRSKDNMDAFDATEKNTIAARKNFNDAVDASNKSNISAFGTMETAKAKYADNIIKQNTAIHKAMADKENTNINNYKAVATAQQARFNGLESQRNNGLVDESKYQDRMQEAIRDSFDAAYKMNDQDLSKWKTENELALREKELLMKQNDPDFKAAGFQNKLNEDFKKSPAYKNYQYVAANFESLANAPLDNPFSVVGVINAATKIWDPNSVTRKSEFDNVQSVLGWFREVKESGIADRIEKENKGVSFAKMERTWNRIWSKGSMTEIDRQELMEAVQPAVKGWKDGYDTELTQKKEFQDMHNVSIENPDGSKYYGLSELKYDQGAAANKFNDAIKIKQAADKEAKKATRTKKEGWFD